MSLVTTTQILIALIVLGSILSAAMLHRFGRAVTGALIGLIPGIGIVIAALMRASLKSEEAQRAHDARLQTMLRATVAAAKKKQAAAAAANSGGATAAPTAAPLPPPAPRAAPERQLRDERECPFCAEPILKKARVCKHCGRDVPPAA